MLSKRARGVTFRQRGSSMDPRLRGDDGFTIN
jgi:hypothetical protein